MSGTWIEYIAMVTPVKRFPLNHGFQPFSCSDTFCNQIYLFNDPLPKISNQAYEMQLCLHCIKSQSLKSNVAYRCCVEQGLIYQIHAHGTISERDPRRIQITPKHKWKTRTTKLATAFRYLIYKQNTFLRHKVIRGLPNAKVL